MTAININWSFRFLLCQLKKTKQLLLFTLPYIAFNCTEESWLHVIIHWEINTAHIELPVKFNPVQFSLDSSVERLMFQIVFTVKTSKSCASPGHFQSLLGATKLPAAPAELSDRRWWSPSGPLNVENRETPRWSLNARPTWLKSIQ